MNKTIVAVSAVVLVGGLAIFWNATRSAPPPGGHSMVPPDTSDIAQGDPIAEVSVPAQLSAEAQIGKRVFEAKCAVCHGTNAAGQNGVAPPLIHPTYRPGHHSDMAFVYAARNGVQSHHWNFGNMPPVEGLTDGDVKMVARYIRELQEENGIF